MFSIGWEAAATVISDRGIETSAWARLIAEREFPVRCLTAAGDWLNKRGDRTPERRPSDMKPFLILQLRPEAEASDDEFRAILDKGGLSEERVHRVRLEHEELPQIDLADYAGVIVGGGPGCVSDAPEDKSPLEKRIEDAVMGLMPAITGGDVPFLGCCYGIGILAHHLGGTVSKERYGEPVSVVRATATEEGRADPLLAGIDGPVERVEGLFDWHVRIRPVRLIQIDVVGAEPLEAGVGARDDLGGCAVARLSLRSRHPAELRREHDVVASCTERRAQELLRFPAAIEIGGKGSET